MRKNKKRLWALLVSAALMAAQLPAARAAEGPEPADSVEKGDFIVEGAELVDSQEGGDFYLDGDVLHITSGKAMTICMRDGVAATTAYRLAVVRNTAANLTLDGVSIDRSSTGATAFSIDSGSSATLTLRGENAFTGGKGCAGIQVPQGAAVAITGAGKLAATGTRDGAGIGGSYNSGFSDQISIAGTVQIYGQGAIVAAKGDRVAVGGGLRADATLGGGGSLSVTEGATLQMIYSGTNARNPEYKNCTIIDRDGHYTVYDGLGTGTAAALWDGTADQSATGLGVQPGGTIAVTGGNTSPAGAKLTIDVDDVTLTSGGNPVSGPNIRVANGIGSLTIRNLDLTARDGEIAIYFASDAALTVEGTCKVTGGAGETGSVAIYDSGDLTVAVGAASLTATGGATTATYNGGHGIFANGALDVNVGHGGSLTAVAGDGGGRGSHALAGGTSVAVRNDGTVLAGDGKVDGKFNKLGITSSGDVTLTGSGTTTAKGVTGIQTGGILTVSGTGTVTAKGTYAGVKFQYGSGGGYQLAGDGTLTAAGIDGEVSSYGIVVIGDLELAFTGSLTAHGGKGLEGHGMYMYGGLTVREAPAALDARPGTGTGGHAIHVNGTTDNQTGYFIPVNTTAPVVWTALGVTPAAPAASPSGGAYGAAQTVTLTCATPGAVIFYTLDGADPTAEGALTYKAPVTVPLGGTLKACAASPGGSFSGVIAETYTQQSGGGGGGGGSSSGSTVTVVTPTPTAEEPDPPTEGVIRPNVSVNKDGQVKVAVSDKDVQSAIDKATAQAKKDGKEANGIAVSIDLSGLKTEFSQLPLTLSKSAYAKLVDAGVKYLRIKTPQISLALDLETLKTIHSAATGDVTIGAAKAETAALPAALQGRPAYDLTITTGGKTISNFGAGYVAVTLPYALQAGEQGGALQMAYVDAAGKVQYIADSSYDAGGKALTGRTSHFTVFGIAQRPAPVFTDIEGHWAQDDILFAASRGLLNGTGDKAFSPESPMTRGMFVTALYRLAGNPQAPGEGSAFTDVPAGAYYADAVSWAVAQGIVSGTGAAAFEPDRAVTRQEMAVLLLRYAGAMGRTVPQTQAAAAFADGDAIAPWAAQAVHTMQRAGVLNGRETGRFDPQGTATRAEAAAVLRRAEALL